GSGARRLLRSGSGQLVVSGDVGDRAWAVADVLAARADEATGALLLQHVRRPAGRAGTHEQRGHHVAGYLGEVEQDRGPVVDVRLHRAVRVTLGQLGDCGLLQLQSHLVPGRAQTLAGLAQDSGTGVVRTVDAVSEAHEAFLVVQRVLDVRRRVAGALDPFDHVLGTRGGSAVQRPGHGPDGPGEAGGGVGAGGGDDAGGE